MKTRLLLLSSIFALSVALASTPNSTSAQSTCGIPGGPLCTSTPQPTTPADDADGDGTADWADQCPTQSGHAANFGCPETAQVTEEAVIAIPAPVFPASELCLVASNQNVNIREYASTHADVVDVLQANQTIMAIFKVLNSDYETWYRVENGYIFSGAVSTNGNCQTKIPTIDTLSAGVDAVFPPSFFDFVNAESPDEDALVIQLEDVLISSYQIERSEAPFINILVGRTPTCPTGLIPECMILSLVIQPNPAICESPTLIDRFSLPEPQDPDDTGLLLPAIQKVREAGIRMESGMMPQFEISAGEMLPPVDPCTVLFLYPSEQSTQEDDGSVVMHFDVLQIVPPIDPEPMPEIGIAPEEGETSGHCTSGSGIHGCSVDIGPFSISAWWDESDGPHGAVCYNSSSGVQTCVPE